MEARGVDINSAMLDLCRRRGLDTVPGDALQYLRSLPDKSQGAVTGFHIIEHLPFEVLMDLFTEVQRVVEPGGFVIFESPNCKNLLVGACSFNIDPTHRNPVFPETAKFMLEILGFHPVELEYLTPISETPFDTDGAIHPVLKDLLYGPQDFAVIGFKAIEA
jgi:O-antigen chain-terminating methyltransferase